MCLVSPLQGFGKLGSWTAQILQQEMGAKVRGGVRAVCVEVGMRGRAC